MQQSEIIVGLDIGTTKICAIVGQKNEYDKFEILGIGRNPSFGVMRGKVFNIEKTVRAINKAVSEAENVAGIDITTVQVGIAGQHIKSLRQRDNIVRDDAEEEIKQADVNQLIEKMHNIALSPGEEIIDVVPEEFTVDGEPGIKDPVGMCGVRLAADFHIITGQVTAIKNIFKCVQKAGLEVENLILEPIASTEAALSADEKKAGTVLIDIGGGTTDIAIFQEGMLRHTSVIPLGGNIITEDVKEGCSIMRDQAEKLKTKFGSALAMETQSNEIVSIPGLKGREPKEISVKNLARIVQARMEEILEHVYFEIRSSGYEEKLIGGIVATGGGAQLSHVPQLIEYVTGMDARIGYPTEHVTSGPSEEVKHPMFSTGVGLVIKGYTTSVANQKNKETRSQHTAHKEKKESWLEALIKKGTRLLEDDDVDIE